MTYFILGGAGLLGSNMAVYIKENIENSRVVGIDKYVPLTTKYYDTFYKLNLSVYNLRIFNYPDYTYNFAANIGDREFLKNYKEVEDKRINLNSLKFLQGSENLFFPSSSQIYSDEELLHKEKKVTVPSSPYGKSKLEFEKFAIAYSKYCNKNIKIARLFNIYGKFDYISESSRVVTSICRKIILATDKINILGNGKQQRHFLFARDACEAIDLYLKNPSPNLLELGSDSSTTIEELVNILLQISNKNLEVEYENKEVTDNIICNNTQFKNFIPWEERTSLLKGLEITYKYIYDQITNL